MNKFSKTIILALFSLGFVMVSFADSLPGDLGNCGNLTVAWEIQESFVQTGGKTREPLYAYLGLGDKTHQGGFVPPVSPGEDDAIFFEYDSEHYSTVSGKTTYYPRSWILVPSTTDGTNCTLTVTRLLGEIPAGVSLKLMSADGSTVVADWSSATDSAPCVTENLKPGIYTVLVTKETVDCTVDMTLCPGWNLFSLPCGWLTSAQVGTGKDAKILTKEIPVFRRDTNRSFTSIESLEDLPEGEALWAYWDGADDATLSMIGKCIVGKSTEFPEYTKGQWTFLGLEVTGDKDSKSEDPRNKPTGTLPAGAYTWSASGQTFITVSGTPEIGVGYIIR